MQINSESPSPWYFTRAATLTELVRVCGLFLQSLVMVETFGGVRNLGYCTEYCTDTQRHADRYILYILSETSNVGQAGKSNVTSEAVVDDPVNPRSSIFHMSYEYWLICGLLSDRLTDRSDRLIVNHSIIDWFFGRASCPLAEPTREESDTSVPTSTLR